MMFLPFEIITAIVEFSDICSARSLCMTNKCLYGVYPRTNRTSVSFNDVPRKFRNRIRNYKNFCDNTRSLDVSGTSIHTKELFTIIVDSKSLTTINVSRCCNVKSSEVVRLLAMKSNRKKIKDRIIHVEFSPKHKDLATFHIAFKGRLISNVIKGPNDDLCCQCGGFYSVQDVRHHTMGTNYMRMCIGCEKEYTCYKCEYLGKYGKYDNNIVYCCSACRRSECANCSYDHPYFTGSEVLCRRCKTLYDP